MTLDQLALLAEIVGGLVVVVSLVYLAHQVRLNTRSLRTDNYGRLLDRMSTIQSKLSEDAELNRIFLIGAEEPGRLTPGERTRFTWALYELFGAGEFMFLQAREGGLPAEVWQRWDATIRWWLSHPGMRAWWKAKPTPMAASFEAYGDEIIRTHQMEPAQLARWRGFVAGRDLGPPGASATELRVVPPVT